ncbi:hypothetical protein GCM10009830_07210 [Glycomyces endophyticus]|uniref:Zn-dependent protease with chaperone function n=2 Tax=Glycomyces endophyticus TaxID=480996 RepID=A0ABN2G397_9ACTN
MLCLALQWGFVPWAILSAALLGLLFAPVIRDSGLPVPVALLGGTAVTVALLMPLVAARRDLYEPLKGEPVSREQAPELWALIEETATAVGGRVPDTLLVDHLPSLSSQREGRRGSAHYTLLIGLQIFTPRTTGQFRALLASHLAGRATSLSLPHEIRVSVWHSYLNIVFTKYYLNPLNLLLWPYSALCFAASSRISAARVLVGDQAAARFAGGANTWSTITEISVLDRLGREFDETHLHPATHVGLLPLDVVDAFSRFLDAVPERRAALRAQPLSNRTGWRDPWPSLARRVAAVLDAPGGLWPGDETPALGLFADPQAIAATVDAMWTAPRTVRGSWEQAAARLEHRHHCDRAARSYQVIGNLLGTSRASLEGLLIEIDGGRRDALFLELDRRGFPAGGLASMVALAAMRSQEMRFEVRWGEGTGLATGDGRPFDPKEIIAPLFAAVPDPDAVRKALAERGVDLHRAAAD